MSYIDRSKHEDLIKQMPGCFEDSAKNESVMSDLEILHKESKELVSGKNIKYTGTWLLERDLWLQSETNVLDKHTETLSRGRVVLVNPGVGNIGREQRYVHPYIVLGEYRDTFIGVPITNMAKDKDSKYYLRHFFEVKLIDPEGEKPFTEYRCTKPSVADVRNISGFDKRRIIQDRLYAEGKYAPSTYLNSISEKIRSSLATII